MYRDNVRYEQDSPDIPRSPQPSSPHQVAQESRKSGRVQISQETVKIWSMLRFALLGVCVGIFNQGNDQGSGLGVHMRVTVMCFEKQRKMNRSSSYNIQV